MNSSATRQRAVEFLSLCVGLAACEESATGKRTLGKRRRCEFKSIAITIGNQGGRGAIKNVKEEYSHKQPGSILAQVYLSGAPEFTVWTAS